jgi:hypothetical protein
MRFSTACAIFLILALAFLVACAEKPAPAPEQKPGAGFSSADAASIGTTVPAMVELSDMYVSPETYDLKVTVAEIVRGEKAGEFLKKAGASEAQIGTDSEYLLARVRLEYSARGAPGDKPWELSGAQFNAYSEEGKPFGSASIVASQSGLKPSLRSGDNLECWLAFVVTTSGRKPVMTFNPGGAWFRLY